MVQRWPHRLLRYLYTRFSWAALVDAVFAFVATVGTAVFTAFTLPKQYRTGGWALFAVLAILGIVRLGVAWFEQKSTARLRQAVMEEVLHVIHQGVFFGAYDFRFTLFFIDPVAQLWWRDGDGRRCCQPILVPLCRFQPGHPDTTGASSKVFYPLDSKATTARAWSEGTPDDGDLPGFILEVPGPFATREAMEDFYIRRGMDRRVVRRFSQYMRDVVQILSFPLTDDHGQPFCLLSVDFRANLRNDDEKQAYETEAPKPKQIMKDVLEGHLAGARAILGRLV